ncbi:MAG TPA: dephospho-CoA kinase [Actinomycetota bacterium]|nr:dephospho-CoA kinase [Actinomycetota bacterium]
MFTVGLTGGIGSGKSTFAVLLAERGAQVIDADQLGRDALRPGQPAWHSVVDTFGDEILVEGSMEIDRRALAAQVFADRNKLAVLNALTHPLIAEGIADALERLSHSDEIVVLDAALIVEMGLDRIVNALIVVDAPDEVRRRRLVARGMTLEDVERRMAAQAPRSELLERADVVVHNAGTLDDLAREADRVWAQLEARAL